MNEHESYVSLETAKMLKEAGFDWEDYFVSHSIDDHFLWEIPLYIAQRWLREAKGIEVNVLCVYMEHIKKYSYTVFTNEYEHEIIDEGFDTYEEAQEAGEKKALELILEKGE